MLADRIHNNVLSELAKSDRKVFQQLMQDLDPHPLQRGAVLGSVRTQQRVRLLHRLRRRLARRADEERQLRGGRAGRPRGRRRHRRRARRAPAALRADRAAARPRLSRAQGADPRAHHVVQLAARAVDELFAAGDAPARAIGGLQPLPHVGATAGALAPAHRRARRDHPLRADPRAPRADGRRAAIGGQPGRVDAARQGHHRLPPRRPHDPQPGAPAQGGLRVLRRRVAGGGPAGAAAAPSRAARKR